MLGCAACLFFFKGRTTDRKSNLKEINKKNECLLRRWLINKPYIFLFFKNALKQLRQSVPEPEKLNNQVIEQCCKSVSVTGLTLRFASSPKPLCLLTVNIPEFLYRNRKTVFSQQTKYERHQYVLKKTAIKRMDTFKSISCGGTTLTTTKRDMYNTVSRSCSTGSELHPARMSPTLSPFPPELELEMERFVWLERPWADSKASALGCTWQVSPVVSQGLWGTRTQILYARLRSHKIWLLHSNSGCLSQALYSSTRTQTYCWRRPTFLSWQ